jgi:hypothetical protein
LTADSGAVNEPRGEFADRNGVRRSVAYILISLVSLAMVLIHVPQHTSVSPIDEYVYIDYLYQVPSQLVVHQGDSTTQAAREYLVCNGVRAIGKYPKEFCRDQARAPEEINQLPNGGLTTADIYTPTYFVITWALAQPMVAFGMNFVEAARYTGAVWLALAGMLLYGALRRFSAGGMLALTGSIFVVASLPAYWSNTYVSTDATGLFAGSLLLYLLSRGLERRRDVALMVAAASFVTLLKVQNLLAVGVVVLFLVIRALVDAWAGRAVGQRTAFRAAIVDRRIRVAIIVAVVPMLLEAAWLWLRSVIPAGPPADQGVSAPFSKSALLNELLKFLPHSMEGAGTTGSTFLDWIGVVGSLVLAAAVIGLALSARSTSIPESFGVTALVLSLIGGPALAIASALGAGYYFLLPSRYSITLVPVFVLCLVLLAQKKKSARVVVSTAALLSAGCILLIPQIG